MIDTGLRNTVLNHYTENADRPMYYKTVANELSLDPVKVNNALVYLKQTYPTRLYRTGRGVYVWYSKAVDVPPAKVMPHGEEILLEVVKDDGEKRLVLDEDGVLWKMQKMADY